MHILKNVSTKVMDHVMGLKDSVAAKKDLQVAGSKQEWWVTDDNQPVAGQGRGRARRRGRGRGRGASQQARVVGAGNTQYRYPPPWIIGHGTTMTRKEAEVELRKRVCSIRPPSGYGPNLRRSFEKSKEDKISGLKSHDHYSLMLDIWPIVLRGLVGKDVHRAIADLAEVLRSICAKQVHKAELPDLKIKTTEALCWMEMAFPTSFMTSQVHVMVHLVDELELCGPVSYRWMFYVEKHMKVLKTMIGQQAKPEGSLAMGYLAKENMFFCSEFFG